MSDWQEPDERTRPEGFGGDWRGTRVTFNNPMSWSIPLVRISGIVVRIHVLFLAFVLVMLMKSMSYTDPISTALPMTAIGLAVLFVIILAHEFGHCIACRMHGGSADEILMWPLGGLASCVPQHRAKAHLWTAIGGPLVNVGLIAVLTPWIGVMYGQWFGLAIPNPLDLQRILNKPEDGEWANFVLLLTNYLAWALLLFNLIPVFPLDGGRILQALLWKRMGYTTSMRAACRTGLIGAIVIGLAGLVVDSTMILMVALFSGVVCFSSLKQLDAERDFLGFDPDPGELASMEAELEEADAAPPRSESKTRAASAKVAASNATAASDSELDRILAKIGKSGIESLSASERIALQKATDEKRGGGGSTRA